MNKKVVITIARQFGSGGREIGEMLAEKLKIPFYDKALIHFAAEASGIDEDLFAFADEKAVQSFWSATSGATGVYGSRLPVFNEIPMNDKLFLIQSNTIKKLASESSCVIVGRCADYILRSEPYALSVFIHSEDEDKINRIIRSYGVPEKEAQETMIKTDKKRASYYNYYSGEKWGRADNYDLAVNTSAVGIEGAVSLIIKFAELKFAESPQSTDTIYP
ncbi:cytidylate kinase-like family protein [Anoxybacterium hadale]|uniref:Cytidylate kinase-like family protein n=1 Tax=Anoxybacterium hadale TaxID=3408580 RepID=A0ACD1A928_9FIRM|nr:cytidylate kinase-like family protein [Clostridiales bacterium]